MMEFEISDLIPASPKDIYNAWLDSAGHSEMTGGLAAVSAKVGDSFEAWDGYIKGRNLVLEDSKRIIQQWRTSEFEEGEKDSLLEIFLEEENEGTRITIRHSELPEHGMQYKQGWVDSYFNPMKEYFGNK
jgi:activator of HSP90 ATPase